MNQQQKAPLIDAVDMEILMHRNAHFGGNFEVMLDYYEQSGIGVMPDFTLEEIKKLKNLEEEIKKDLGEIYLPEEAKKVVEASAQLYKKLRDVYAEEKVDSLALLMSDLILAEEIIPEREIGALVDAGSDVVPLLLHLLQSDSFYDPLFPGYGRSPIFAARALAQIEDERAIPPLFEALGQDNFFTDEEIIKALSSFGEKATLFLLRRLAQKPFSKENEYAAIALNAFPESAEISHACLELLEQEEVLKKIPLANYLIFNCSGLKGEEERKRFRALTEREEVSGELQKEMEVVIRNWK